MAAFTSPLRDPVSIRVLAVCARHNNSAGFLAGKRRHQPSLTSQSRRKKKDRLAAVSPKSDQVF